MLFQCTPLARRPKHKLFNTQAFGDTCAQAFKNTKKINSCLVHHLGNTNTVETFPMNILLKIRGKVASFDYTTFGNSEKLHQELEVLLPHFMCVT